MNPCTVCGLPTPGEHALTSLTSAPTENDGWRHEVLSLCRKCQDRLLVAGADGVLNVDSGRRLWLGHETGGPARILRDRRRYTRDST
jgi:hypothetical protein